MVNCGTFGIKLVSWRKLILSALALVAYRVEPSYAICPCYAITYCSFVSLTELIVSGYIVKSCLREYRQSDSELVAESCIAKGWSRAQAEEGYQDDDTYFISEYELTVDHIYKDEVDFAVPDTPKTINFTSSGRGIEGCRLDLEFGVEYVVGISVQKDDSYSSAICSITKAVRDLTEVEIAVLEAGGCRSTLEEVP